MHTGAVTGTLTGCIMPSHRLYYPVLNCSMTLKCCPNAECVNFQCEVETSITPCRMCAWEMQLVRKQSDSAKEDGRNRETKTA